MNAAGEVRTAARRVCSACGATYAERDWVTLEVSERIGPGDLRRLVVDWPDAMCVEVRRCACCGHTIAAKRELRSA
jgi:hypothetical protein